MHGIGVLRDLVVIFAAAIGVVLLLSRLRLPTIAGFIVAGAILGPGGLGAVRDVREVERLAEVGVALLLFTVGLEAGDVLCLVGDEEQIAAARELLAAGPDGAHAPSSPPPGGAS
jgi:predicted Kef-type K+ transport protein